MAAAICFQGDGCAGASGEYIGDAADAVDGYPRIACRDEDAHTCVSMKAQGFT
jgi:hypothetical protein